jgi:XTP/dITP diphosphohydrolase
MIVVAATQNKHKIKEIDAITRPFGFDLKTLSEIGLSDIDVVEDGETFEENSYKKAMEIHKACGFTTLADDSGLMVDALSGAPGVYSARFAGEEGNDRLNNEKLLSMLAGLAPSEKTARFVSVITMVFPDGGVLSARGECEGHMISAPAGDNGFGYDPLFVPLGYDRTFAELSAEEKNRISHRANALSALAELLKEKQSKQE